METMIGPPARRRRLDMSRRKVAAIAFLSNIEAQGDEDLPGYRCLEGTQVLESYRRQKNYRRLIDKERDVKNAASQQKTAAVVETQETPISTSKEQVSNSGSSGSRDKTPECDAGSSTGKKVGMFAGVGGRRGGSAEQLGEKSRRKLTYHNQYSDDGRLERGGAGESSCESLGMMVNHGGGSRRRQESGNPSESSHTSKISVASRTSHNSGGHKEFRFIGPGENKYLTEERLIMVTSNKVPFAIASTVLYHKTQRASRRHSGSRLSFRGEHHRHEGSKKLRHHSGTLPAINDAINDGFDPFELLGLGRLEDGQEISYSSLLAPSYRNLPQPPDLDRANKVEDSGRGSPRPSRASPITVGMAGAKGSPPVYTPCSKGGRTSPTGESAWGHPTGPPYSPHILDGWLGAGKHRTFLPFPSYITSVIEYVRPSDMKKELNEKFREKFPTVQLTLSKLRSLKDEMRRIGMECNIDSVTIAQAFVYFEKLVLKNVINKLNRKFCAGACIILSAKLNDIKGDLLKNLIEKTETIYRLNRKDLLSSEFAVLVALEFSLHVPTQEVYPHYQRLLYST